MLRFCYSRNRTGRTWKNHSNGRSFAELAFGFDPAAVQLNNMLHDREPEAGSAKFAAPRLVRPVESLEDPGQIFPADASPTVAYGKDDFAILAFPRQADGPAVTRIFHRIIEKIVENFSQPLLIGADT